MNKHIYITALLYAVMIGVTKCEETNYTNYGDLGWCFGGNDDYIGKTSSAEDCWTKCYEEYESDLIAVDWWEHGFSSGSRSDDGVCYCQDNCPCRSDSGSGSTLLVANKLGAFPDECSDFPVQMANDVGWCYGGSDYYRGVRSSANQCWNDCFSLFGDNLYAIDFWDAVGACYCQDACDCMANIGSGGTLIISGYIATKQSELPNECTYTDDDYSFDDDKKGNGVNSLSGAALAFIIIGGMVVSTMLCYACSPSKRMRNVVAASAEGEIVSNENGIAMTVRDAPAVLVSNGDVEVVSCEGVRVVDGGDDPESENEVTSGAGDKQGVPVVQAKSIVVASRVSGQGNSREATL